MNKLISFAVISITVATLAGCAPGQNTPGATIVGAAAGGLIGSQIFGDSVVGGFAGALVGGSVGYAIGRHMDRQDRANMQSAIIETPIGDRATWRNERTHVTYEVTPVRGYRYHEQYCREYRTRVKIGDRWRTAYGKACRKPDGSWHIVS